MLMPDGSLKGWLLDLELVSGSARVCQNFVQGKKEASAHVSAQTC